MPRLTVAILAYNRPEFLGEAIRSVLNQTYTDFKLIVYDNCSTIDIKHVVDSFDDPRVIYHRNSENLGQFGNAAQAVDLCDTELLDIFHDDDRMFPWALERLVDAMDRYPSIGTASTFRAYIMGSGDFHKFKEQKTGRIVSGKELAILTVKNNKFLSFGGIMIKPEKLRRENVNFRANGGPAGDVLFSIELGFSGVESFVYDAPMMEYRMHSMSGTNTTNAKEWYDSHKRIYDAASSGGMNDSDIFPLQLKYVRWSLLTYSESIFQTENADAIMSALSERRKLIERDFNFEISQPLFSDCVSIGALRQIITAVGRRELPIRSYLERRAELEKIGVKMPLKRRLMWFAKYIIAQRMLGIHQG